MPKIVKFAFLIGAILIILAYVIEEDEEESDNLDLYAPVHDVMQDAIKQSSEYPK
jgi:hypothetical protein